MPTARSGAVAGVIDGKLYVAGGEYFNSLEVYDPSTDSWTIKTSMPNAREFAAAGVIDGKLYCVGGTYSGGALAINMEIYDPSTDSWTTDTSTPARRRLAAAGVIDGKLYVVGGLFGITTVNTLEVYDPSTVSWTTKTSMPTARFGATAGVIDGILYVAGGVGGANVLEAYDPSTNSWTTKTSMPTARTRAAAGVIDGKLYVAGGSISNQELKTHEVYDPLTDSWFTRSSMPTARDRAAAGIIDWKLYVAGGSGSSTLEAYDARPLKAERLSLDPAAGEQDVPPEARIKVDFNWPVESSTINSSTIVVLSSSSGTVAGNHSYEDQINTAFFEPIAAFTPGDSITVTISGAIQDTGGIGFNGNNNGVIEGSPADDYVYGFRIGTQNPTITIDSLSNHLSYPTGDIDIHYTTSSPGSSYLVTSDWEFSRDNINWNTIDATAISGNTAQLPGPHTITWSTTTGTNNLDELIDSSVWFRMKVNDGNYNSAYSNSGSFAVDNNLPPTIALDPVSGEQTGDIVINYSLNDSGQDTLSIVPEYSLNQGSNWSAATVIGKTSGILPNEWSGSLTWLVTTDLPPRLDQDDIQFRVTPHDRYEGTADTLSAIHVDSNAPPSVVLTDLSGTQIDTVTIQYVLSDATNDTLSIITEYSTDAGANWLTATVIGQTSGIVASGYSDSLQWLSHVDLPSITSVTTRFRITPADNDQGTADETINFTLANNAPPTVSISLEEVYGGQVTVRYSLSDLENDTLSLITSYSTDGNSWSTGTVSGPTSGIVAADYDSVLVWQSSADIPGYTNTAYFRITPEDVENGSVTSSITSFYLDNKPPEWITAIGSSGVSTIMFWFNELVAEITAIDTANFSLSGGLSIESISGIGNEVWTTRTSMPTNRNGAVAGVINGKIYVAGGDGYSNKLVVYDPLTDLWTAKASMSIARQNAAAGVIHGKLYVAGGYNGSYLNALEVYDPLTDRWSTKNPMPYSDWGMAAGVIGGELYVVGGMTTGRLQVYNPQTDSWTIKTSMHTHRWLAAAGVIGGKLYVAGGDLDGGYRALNTLEVYDPFSDSWTEMTPMPTIRMGAAAGVINGILYVAGGYQTIGGQYNMLEAFDPSTNSWTTKSSMPTSRSQTAATVIDGKLYVIGGQAGQGGGGYLNTVEVYTAEPDTFLLTLANDQVLPGSGTPVSLIASEIVDLYGNIAAILDTTFYALSGEVPSITIDPLSGVQSGDIVVSYTLIDAENNPISLRAEYSTDSGTTWSPATVIGDTSDIPEANYVGSLTWNSKTDLPDQAFPEVHFRITPRDHPVVTGDPAMCSFGLDNKAPAYIEAFGVSGESEITFWFDEDVDVNGVTGSNNFSLTGGLGVGSISTEGFDSWSSGADLPANRNATCSAVIGGKLYVVGGQDEPEVWLNSIFAYDPVSDTWVSRTPMPTARANPAVTAFDGRLYVFGGYNGEYLNTVEVFNPDSNHWSTVSSMPTRRFGALAVVIDNQIFVLGGKDQTETITDVVEIYDPAGDSWSTGISLPSPRRFMSGGVIGGNLYVAGGGSGSAIDIVEVFKPGSGTWESRAPMPIAKTYAMFGVIGDRLYVAGGYGGGTTYYNSVDIYHPATNQWSGVAPLPTARMGRASGVIGGRLYVAGGEDLAGDLKSLVIYTSPNTFTLNLAPGDTLPFQTVTLQTSGITDLYGNSSGILAAEIPLPTNNANPWINLVEEPSEISSDVTIEYQIEDMEGNQIRLIPEYYSVEQDTWIRATTASDTINIGSWAYVGSLMWHSFNDLPGLDFEETLFRLTPADNDLEVGQADSIVFHLDNNLVPSITLNSSTYTRADSIWTFDYMLSDPEGDSLSILAEYSTDSGVTWLPATVSGDTSDIVSSSYSGNLVWLTERDLPLATMEVLFRLTPNDLDIGVAAETTIILNALDLPALAISSQFNTEQDGDIPVDYQITDGQGDVMSLQCEYLVPSGSWTAATVDGNTSGIGPTQYTGQITWKSAIDLPGLDSDNVGFRITPSDFNTGFAGTTYFHLDNNEVPAVALSLPSGVQSRDVTIGCTLSDDEGDMLDLSIRWSTDKTTWHMMQVTGDTIGITPTGYSGTFIWDSFEDLGYGVVDSVWIRLTPRDLDSGAPTIGTALTVANYVGDYTGDIQVNFSDFATLVTAWNQQNTYHDIGPATGSVPNLIPESDGVIDFEDLTVYLQMWTWSAANLSNVAEQQVRLNRPASNSSTWAGVGEIEQQHPVVLIQPPPEDVWKPDDGIIRLNLEAHDVVGVTASGTIIHYDTDHLKFLDVQPGTFLGRTGASDPGQIFVKQIDEETGRIELMLGRISPDNPTTGGSGVLATLQFVKLSKENSTVSVSYDLRDKSADLITSDIYQTTVEATFIPKDFALLQNYPNPFNSETVIRFQLPQAARVQMYVFNIRGQRVATLVDEQMDPGYHKITWDGRNDDNRKVASGIYIYLIQANRNRASQKLTIIK